MKLGSYRPVSGQLVDYLAMEILGGELVPGEALPEVNSMALSTQVNPSIVERAYKELEAAGVLERGPGGLRVAQAALELLRASEAERFMRHDRPAIARRLRLLGLDPARIEWDEGAPQGGDADNG